MPTLDQISAAGGLITDRQRYNDYVIACQEQGKKAMTFEAWIAAGRPDGPPAN